MLNLRLMLLPILAMWIIPAVAAPIPAWVQMAPGGGSVVRALVKADSCPVVHSSDHIVPMTDRVGPATLPLRANKAGQATPAAFPTRVCEAHLPRSAHHASLDGQRLPLPRAQINRIVLIGDTGCRLKASEAAWQNCNDPAQWPFAAIAARAAALHPDLVLHVGDYHYRENSCPPDQSQCADTPAGYGEAGWRADFFDPAAPLLAAAPWVMVRGNHEECARAGQGWWRLLDPHPLRAGSDCVDPANDATSNHTDPYAVRLGGNAQLVVADLMELASGKPGDSAATAAFARDMAAIDALARRSKTSFFTAHFPFNPVLWDKYGPGAIAVGGKPLDAFNPPPLHHIRAMLAGHIHLFQVARFSDRPTQVITGFSGTLEDVPLGPASLAEAAGTPGAPTLTALTTIPDRFGYALMERRAHGWRLTAYGVDGKAMAQFPL